MPLGASSEQADGPASHSSGRRSPLPRKGWGGGGGTAALSFHLLWPEEDAQTEEQSPGMSSRGTELPLKRPSAVSLGTGQSTLYTRLDASCTPRCPEKERYYYPHLTDAENEASGFIPGTWQCLALNVAAVNSALLLYLQRCQGQAHSALPKANLTTSQGHRLPPRLASSSRSHPKSVPSFTNPCALG